VLIWDSFSPKSNKNCAFVAVGQPTTSLDETDPTYNTAKFQRTYGSIAYTEYTTGLSDVEAGEDVALVMQAAEVQEERQFWKVHVALLGVVVAFCVFTLGCLIFLGLSGDHV
jgi:hypothetical protein